MPKKPKDLAALVIDPSDYASMNTYKQPIDTNNEVLTIEETHPRLKKWQLLHPALEIDIDQRLYKFISESSPAIRGIWKHWIEKAREKDIDLRIHRREIQLMLDIKAEDDHERLIQNFFKTLFFERIYENALKREQILKKSRNKKWEDTLEFTRMMREHFQKNLVKKQIYRKELLVDPYVPELTVPNEKKDLHLYQEKNAEDHRDKVDFRSEYLSGRNSTIKVMHESISQALKLANHQLFQTGSIKQAKIILEAFDHKWTALFKQLQGTQVAHIPIIDNNSGLKDPIDVDNSARGDGVPRTMQTPKGPYKDQIVSRTVGINVIIDLQDPKTSLKEYSRDYVINSYGRYFQPAGSERVSARNEYTSIPNNDAEANHSDMIKEGPEKDRKLEIASYEHLRHQAAYPKLFTEALSGEQSFDVKRANSEAPRELELLNKDFEKSKDKLENNISDKEIKVFVEEYQKSQSRILAGHDYAKHHLAEPPSEPVKTEFTPEPKDKTNPIEKTLGAGKIDHKKTG